MDTADESMNETQIPHEATPPGATFRARALSLTNPGLKPWAESFSPFGACPWSLHVLESQTANCEP